MHRLPIGQSSVRSVYWGVEHKGSHKCLLEKQQRSLRFERSKAGTWACCPDSGHELSNNIGGKKGHLGVRCVVETTRQRPLLLARHA
jgi:hypothetical protein